MTRLVDAWRYVSKARYSVLGFVVLHLVANIIDGTLR